MLWTGYFYPGIVGLRTALKPEGFPGWKRGGTAQAGEGNSMCEGTAAVGKDTAMPGQALVREVGDLGVMMAGLVLN